MKLSEMGTDGQGGNSEAFWMRYPFPFLNFWYATYPLQPTAIDTTAEVTADVTAEAEVETEEKAKTRSIVYKYLELVRSEKKPREAARSMCLPARW